jgi:peptidoglycan/LPS O-acetylase OafA/YrhL
MSAVPSQAAPTRGAGRLDEVDSLRAAAMTAVIAQHCHILPFGWMGVWLFFVISGFVVTTSLMARPAEPSRILLTRFYVRRAARILPIYLGYVVVGLVISGLALGRFEWSPFASLVLFYNNVQSSFGVGIFKQFPVAHLWTISVEMQFYLLFGFAFALLARRRLWILLASMLLISPILRFVGGEWLSHAGYSPLRAAFAVYTLPGMHFDSFAAGALLALGPDRWRRPPWAWGLLLAGGLAICAYALAYVLVNRAHGAAGLGAYRNVISGILFGQQRQVWLYSALAALSAGVLALTLTGAAPWSVITRSPLLQAVGRASYGGYVYHALCVWLIRPPLEALIVRPRGMVGKLELGVAVFVVAWSATVILSLVSYRWVEQPIIAAVNRRLAGRGSPLRFDRRPVASTADGSR